MYGIVEFYDIGMDGLIILFFLFELFIICFNLLLFFIEFFVFEVCRGEGYEFMGFVFGFCFFVFKKFLIKEVVEIFKFLLDVGLMEMECWFLEFEWCR